MPLVIEIDGVARLALDSDALAERATNLQARDRRAWRLTELIDNTYLRRKTMIHAQTVDGGDYIVNENGRQPDDIIVVRRNTGELYLGWLDGRGDRDRPLADAERPAERIERVARIELAAPAAAPDAAPARLAVIIDGEPRPIVTAEGFAALARTEIKGQREGAAAAIDVAHAFGGPMLIVGVTAGGRRLALPPPGRDARPVIYLTRRGRFKFAWVDPGGEPITGTKLRDVTEIALARR